MKLKEWVRLYDEITAASAKLMGNNAGLVFVNPQKKSNLESLVSTMNHEVYTLLGIDKSLKITVSNGLIRFKIPSDWTEDTRYEILDENMQAISSGFINRSALNMLFI